MRKLFLLGAAMVVALPFASAKASLILVEPGGTTPATSVADSFTSLGADGFGDAHRLLTLQTNGVETGSGTPVDVANGDAVPGADKTETPTISAIGWTSGASVGIGFNSDQSGHTGITMQSLTLTIYNGTTAVGSFSLDPSETPLTFTADDLALQQGNGNAVFDFGLTAAEQPAFNAILAMSGSSGFFVGLAASLGCPAGAPADCLPSNDGPDSFLAFDQSIGTPGVPEPSTWAMLLIGFGGLGYAAYRRKEKSRLEVIA